MKETGYNWKGDNGRLREPETGQRKTARKGKKTTENSQNCKADNGKQPELESRQRKTARTRKRTTENSQRWKVDNGKQPELESGQRKTGRTGKGKRDCWRLDGGVQGGGWTDTRPLMLVYIYITAKYNFLC